MSDQAAPPTDDLDKRIDEEINRLIDAQISALAPAPEPYAAAKSGLAKIGKPGSYVASAGAPEVPDFSVADAVSGPDGAERTIQEIGQNNAAADAQFRKDSGTNQSPIEGLLGGPGGSLKNLLEARDFGDLVDRQANTMANIPRGFNALMGKLFNPFATLSQSVARDTDYHAGSDPSLPTQVAKSTIDFMTGRPILEGMGAVGQGMEGAKGKLREMGVSKDLAELGVEGGAALAGLGMDKLAKVGKSVAAGRRARLSQEGKLPSTLTSESVPMRTKLLGAIDDVDLAVAAEKRAALVAEGKPVPYELRAPQNQALIDAVANADASAPGKVPFHETAQARAFHAEEVRRQVFPDAKVVDDAAAKTAASLDQAVLEMDRNPNMPRPLDMFRKFDATDPPAYMINPMMTWAAPVFNKVNRMADRMGFVWEPKAVGTNYATLRTQLDGRMALDEIDTATAIEDLRTATEALDDAGKGRVREFMAGEIDTMGNVPIETVQQVVKIKKDVFGLTEAQVQREILSREVADEYQAGFLARVFEKGAERFPKSGVKPPAALGLEFPNIRRDAPGVVVTAPVELVQAIADDFSTAIVKEVDGRTLVKFEKGDVASRDAFVQRLADPEVRKLHGVERKPYLRKIEELTPEQLEEIGQVLDPEIPLATTMYRARRRILQYDFLESLRTMEEPDIGRLVTDEPTPGFVQVERRGPLQGKYLHEQVFDDIEANFGPTPEQGFGRQVWDGFLAGWKLNKTVLSPRTAARQAYSMPYFFGYGGLKAMKHVPEAMRSMRKGTSAFKNWDALFTEWGIDGGARFTEAEIAKVFNRLKETKNQKAVSVPFTGREVRFTGRELGQMMSAPWANHNLAKKAARIYNIPDIVTRKALFMHYVDDLKMSPARATLEVNKWTPNYAQVGKSVDVMRKAPLGAPFFTFKAEMYRIQMNALREKPLMFALQMGSNKLMQGAAGLALADAMGAFGEDDALLERERKAITMSKGGGAMPVFRDSEGRQRVFDNLFVDPNSDSRELLSKGADYMLRTLGSDFRFNEQHDTDLDSNAFLDAAEAVGFGSNPSVSIPTKLITGRDPQTGRQLDQSVPMTAAQDILPGMTPFVGRDFNKFAASVAGEQPSPYRAKQDPFTMAMDSLLGLTLTPFDTDLEKARVAMRAKMLIGQEKSALRKQERKFTLFKTTPESATREIREITRKARKRLDALDGASR